MKTPKRFLILKIASVAGVVTSLFLLLSPFIDKEQNFCKISSFFECGSAEELIGLPWLQPFNAALGIIAFLYFTVMAFKLPSLDPENTKPRKILFYFATVGFCYAIFLRILEGMITGGKICPWCLLLFICSMVATICIWIEWCVHSEQFDNTFIHKDFISNMIKLITVVLLCSVVTICTISEPLTDKHLLFLRNLQNAGFDQRNPYETIKKWSDENGSQYLVFIYKKSCNACHSMARGFNKPEIKNLLAKIPLTQIPYEEPSAQKLLADNDVSGVPVIMIFNSKHELKSKIFGRQDDEELVKKLREAIIVK